MLTDHRLLQERWALEERKAWGLPRAFGRFITDLATWNWFFNPLTFRDQSPDSGPPVPQFTLHRVIEYLSCLQRAAGQPIGWVIVGEFGR